MEMLNLRMANIFKVKKLLEIKASIYWLVYLHKFFSFIKKLTSKNIRNSPFANSIYFRIIRLLQKIYHAFKLPEQHTKRIGF